jgi:hypothetical protein
MTDTDPSVPPGARLVHIGFAKTGTTSVQGALSMARPQLAAHGVIYPGRQRYHKAAGVYISRTVPRLGDPKVRERDWTRLVRQTEAAGDNRVVISSEWLAETPIDNVRRVVNELGGERVHVVATLRPLVRIMPSTWQQYLQNGLRMPYYRWLRGMLLRPPYDLPTPSFWKRHDHSAILARWADVAGPDHVTAIIVDPTDHLFVLRAFEGLLALPDGLLVPEPPERENRALTWPEAEMLRMVNRTFHQLGWSNALWRSTVLPGVVDRLAELRPEVDMPRLEMPRWAVDRATEIGAGFARDIGGLGIRVIGDLDSLGAPPAKMYEGRPPRAMVPASIAAESIIAAIARSLETGYVEGHAAYRAATAAESLPKATPRPKHAIPPKLRRRLIRTYRRLVG